MERKVSTLLAIAIAAGAMTGATAAPTLPPQNLATAQQAADGNAALIAASLDVTLEKARSIMVTDELSADLAESLAEKYASRLAGMYIDHADGHRLVVRLTGPQAERTQFRHKGADTLEVHFEPGALHTRKQLKEAFAESLAKAATDMPDVHGQYLDERTGEIVFEVDPGTNIEAVQRSAKSVIDVPFRVEEAPRAATAALFGSGRLVQSVCTNGFVVNHATLGVRGTLAAGHCATGSAQTYTGVDGAVHTVSQQSVLANANADIMWLSIPNTVSYGGYIWDGSAWRAVTGRRTQGATMVGNTHCKYGQTGGGSCGTVQSTTASPGNACGPGPVFDKPCNMNFVRVQGPGLYCIRGDSGGPFWTLTTLAAGVLTHAIVGGGNTCWYTSTDYAYNNFGLNLVYP
ncbi:S1 family peptidase [Luteimonas sp. XNQY3]|nr:S1 family peptidase [Luteimonas sp. XNQY3]MCD9007457.1 S1 family peptidase [Luteimonas sp. XNQY3]